jgi:hypothetical protein
MTDADLVSRGKKLYEQILSISFSNDEMLAFGQAVFGKTPWGALKPTTKIAMFRLAAGMAPPSDGGEMPLAGGALPVAELVGDTAEQPTISETRDDLDALPDADETDQ